MPFMPSLFIPFLFSSKAHIPSPAKTCEVFPNLPRRKGQVSIGVVEHAMFWDLPRLGTIDVVCNRAWVCVLVLFCFFREPHGKGGGENIKKTHQEFEGNFGNSISFLFFFEGDAFWIGETHPLE